MKNKVFKPPKIKPIQPPVMVFKKGAENIFRIENEEDEEEKKDDDEEPQQEAEAEQEKEKEPENEQEQNEIKEDAE